MPQKSLTAFLLLGAALTIFAQRTRVGGQAPRTDRSGTAAEQKAQAGFLAARSAGIVPLQAFLRRMPKGADLHMHLSGAVYAETFLKDAVQD